MLPPRINPEALFEHVGFLRGLARSLLFDDAEADDVVQDTLAVALVQPPRHPSRLRAFLAGVTRNLAYKTRRSESRRRQRERAAALPESLASTASVAERIEVQRRVVNAVDQLPEPYRTTIVHRFFDDRPPREIARVMDVPVKTVDTRLRRALQKLRLALDDAYREDPRTWRFGLLALAGSTTGSALPVAATLAIALTAFGAGYSLATAPDAPASTELATAPHAGVTGELEDARARSREIARRLAALVPRTREEGSRIAQQDPRRPTFLFAPHEDALRAIDWDLAARAILILRPLLADLVGAGDGTFPVPETAGLAQRWNGELVKAALTLSHRGIPGETPNEVLLHPLVVANLAGAVLRRAGAPLSPAQGIAVRTLLRDWNPQPLAADGPILARVHASLQNRTRFLARLERHLTAKQRNILRPQTYRGQGITDLFGPGLVWGARARALPYDAATGPARAVLAHLVGVLELDTDQTARARPLVAAWAAALPRPGPDPKHGVRLMPTKHLKDLAVRQLSLSAALTAGLALTDAQRARLDAIGYVIVPVAVNR